MYHTLSSMWWVPCGGSFLDWMVHAGQRTRLPLDCALLRAPFHVRLLGGWRGHPLTREDTDGMRLMDDLERTCDGAAASTSRVTDTTWGVAVAAVGGTYFARVVYQPDVLCCRTPPGMGAG